MSNLKTMLSELKDDDVLHIVFPKLHLLIYNVDSVTATKDGTIYINNVYGQQRIVKATDEILNTESLKLCDIFHL